MNDDSGKLMAIKQIKINMQNEETFAQKFAQIRKEIMFLETVEHEHIVKYMGSETTNDYLYIFMEYVPGGSIRELLHKFKTFDESVIRAYTRQILSGLQYLHSKKIAHRDIKGANILVSADGIVKLADFGCSKMLADFTVNTNNSLKGTP
jgi:mitogen-activated protein kinase kinase kinase 3